MPGRSTPPEDSWFRVTRSCDARRVGRLGVRRLEGGAVAGRKQRQACTGPNLQVNAKGARNEGQSVAGLDLVRLAVGHTACSSAAQPGRQAGQGGCCPCSGHLAHAYLAPALPAPTARCTHLSQRHSRRQGCNRTGTLSGRLTGCLSSRRKTPAPRSARPFAGQSAG